MRPVYKVIGYVQFILGILALTWYIINSGAVGLDGTAKLYMIATPLACIVFGGLTAICQKDADLSTKIILPILGVLFSTLLFLYIQLFNWLWNWESWEGRLIAVVGTGGVLYLAGTGGLTLLVSALVAGGYGASSSSGDSSDSDYSYGNVSSSSSNGFAGLSDEENLVRDLMTQHMDDTFGEGWGNDC